MSDSKRSSMRAHASYDDSVFATVHSGSGIPIQCQFCSAQRFRRSRLRSTDFKQILMMRYPVRCLRCSQRQLVSFTVAGVSVPSHIKQRRARHELGEKQHWKEPTQEPLQPSSDSQVERDEADDLR